MDDFEFCQRARARYRFWNDPRLSIRHDRYPESCRTWLGYKWRRRFRIGEKLVSHARLYARIPGIVAAALAPWIGLGLLLVLAGVQAGIASGPRRRLFGADSRRSGGLGG